MIGRMQAARATRGEDGFTMVEMAVILMVMGILLAITIPIVSTLLQTSSKVNVTYSNVDEQLWLSTTLQRLVRAAVAPTPTVTGTQTVPGFVAGKISPTSMQFYTNTGTKDGPERVTVSCTATPSTKKLCEKKIATFTVTMYRAQVTPSTGKSFCPFLSGTTGKHCSYTKTTVGGKKPTITKRTLVTIPNVRNGTNGQVLFTYRYVVPSPTSGKAPTLKTATATDAVFSSCTAGTPIAPFKNCASGEIESVQYDLQINERTTSQYGGSQAEDDTGIFVLSSTSMGYEPSVG